MKITPIKLFILFWFVIGLVVYTISWIKTEDQLKKVQKKQQTSIHSIK